MKNATNLLFVFLVLLISSCNKKEDAINTNYEADIEDLDAAGLPKITFKAQLPTIPSGQEYTIDVTQWDIPTNGTDPVKTTANLQEAVG